MPRRPLLIIGSPLVVLLVIAVFGCGGMSGAHRLDVAAGQQPSTFGPGWVARHMTDRPPTD